MSLCKSLGLAFAIVLAGCSDTPAQPPGGGNVAGTWHFAGSAALANNPDFDNVKKMLALKTSDEFQDLVLHRFAGWLGESLFSSSNGEAASIVRPLLDDLVSAESVWSAGGTANGPLNFIVALNLKDQRVQAWQAALAKLHPPAGFRTVQAKEWLIIEYGRDLEDQMAHYLDAAAKNGRPAPALNQSWLEADIDLPHLRQWLPDFPTILQPARIKATFTSPNHSVLMTAKVVYPKPIPWKFDAWRIPTDIIRDPLISFTAGQDIAAYMDANEPLSKLTDNPLAGQYYVWALGQMVLQTYAAWPVTDPTNALQRLATEATAAFNPGIKRIGAGELSWKPEEKALHWLNVSPILGPVLQVAPETNGPYLLTSFFPLMTKNKAAPDDLFQQVRGRTNLVYYDWEGTGQRMMQWRLLSGSLPIFPKLSLPAPAEISTNHPVQISSTSNNPPPLSGRGANPTNLPPVVRRDLTALVTEENWLTGITPMLVDHETITEITRTAPDELTIVRKSPFAVSSLELVLLSHWLSGAGSPGINPSLLPAKAKVSGPGIKPDGH